MSSDARRVDASSFEFSVVHHIGDHPDPDHLQLLRDFLSAEQAFRGCLGTEGPSHRTTADHGVWTTRTRWRDVECFVAWMVSPQRQALLKRAEALGYDYQASTNWQGYAEWLQLPGRRSPPIWKTNLLVLLCIYPTVLLLNRHLSRLELESASLILIGNILSVGLTGWLLIPWCQRLVERWLVGQLGRAAAVLTSLSITAVIALIWALARWVGSGA